MQICLVSQEYPPDTVRGGIGVQTWNKARELVRLGHAVHVLSCSADSQGDVSTTFDGGITVHRIQPPGVEFAVYATPTYWFGYSWLVLRQLSRLIQAHPFDVIDFPEYGAEGFAYQLDRTPWNWVPVVVQLHAPLAMFGEHIGWPPKESDFFRVGTFMEGFSIREADGLMACSVNIADFTAAYYGVPREGIDVVFCGVDTAAFRPPTENERAEATEHTVLFVGNIALNKGLHTTIEAVLRIRHKYPDIRLQILGKTDDAENELLQNFRNRIAEAGAQSNVEFVGFVPRERLPSYYRASQVFCSPASYEGGVANVYIEAMASSCPVIASAAGGAPEAVINGETGFIVPPNDVEAVASALDRLLRSRRLRLEMGDAGRRRVEAQFSTDKYIERVLATYERAIKRSRHKLEQLRGSGGRC